MTDRLLLYSKSPEYYFKHQHEGYGEEYLKKYSYTDESGRRYRLDNLTGPGDAAKGNPSYEVMGITRFWKN